MRRLLWLVVLAAVVWSGWWFFAATALQNGVTAWLAERRAEGWQADIGGMALSGFPADVILTLQEPALADPDTGVAVQASAFALSVEAARPQNAKLALPQDRIQLATPDGRSAVTFGEGLARMNLHPGSEYELDVLRFDATDWTLEDAAGTVLSAGATRLGMVQDDQDPGRYEINISADALTPGQVPRDRLGIPADRPLAFETFGLSMRVQFDRPWDRRALEDRRPQPQQINLDRAEIGWGTLSLRASADLGIDQSGMPSGTFSVQARNWREILDLIIAAGVLPAQLRPQIEGVLNAAAGASGNPNHFDVTMTLENGLIRVGFLPIGPAPRIRLR